MNFVQVFRRVFLALYSAPDRDRLDSVYDPRLAGFPVSICYTSLRGELGPEYATYYFDPGNVRRELQKNVGFGTAQLLQPFRNCAHIDAVQTNWDGQGVALME